MSKATIIKGEKIELELYILDENERPKDLTGFDEICFCITDINGDVLEKKLSLGEITVTEPKLGELKISLLEADTELLKAENNQDFDLKISNSTTSELRIVKFQRALDVEDSICP